MVLEAFQGYSMSLRVVPKGFNGLIRDFRVVLGKLRSFWGCFRNSRGFQGDSGPFLWVSGALQGFTRVSVIFQVVSERSEDVP